MSLILAIDQGTTSTRTVLYDSNFTALDQNQIEITQYYPKPGYVEHDAQEIWDKTFLTISSLLEKNGLDASQIISIGITNQRETIVGWDQKTGKPIGNAIVWQDKRTTNYCKTLQNKGVEKEVIEKTGLLLDPYFSASKLRWLNDNFKEEIVYHSGKDGYDMTKPYNKYGALARDGISCMSCHQIIDDGKSLKEWRKNHTPSFLDCLKIAISITESINEIHSKHKLIHRDISAHNILINENIN